MTENLNERLRFEFFCQRNVGSVSAPGRSAPLIFFYVAQKLLMVFLPAVHQASEKYVFLPQEQMCCIKKELALQMWTPQMFTLTFFLHSVHLTVNNKYVSLCCYVSNSTFPSSYKGHMEILLLFSFLGRGHLSTVGYWTTNLPPGEKPTLSADLCLLSCMSLQSTLF